MHEKTCRSVVKSIVWRAVAFADTSFLAYLFTGHALQAFKISGFELLTKSMLYVLHERCWLRFAAWHDATKIHRRPYRDTHRYSAAKAVTWRFFGSIDTFVISYLVTGNMSMSVSIGVAELFTKSVLYYLHERAWMRVVWGMRLSPSVTPDEAPPTKAPPALAGEHR